MHTSGLNCLLTFTAWLVLSLFLRAENPKPARPVSPSSGSSLTAQSRFSNTSWRNKDATITMDFFNAGSWHEHYHKELFYGSWKIVSEKEAIVLAANGKVFHYFISDDGKSLTRDDKIKYFPNKDN